MKTKIWKIKSTEESNSKIINYIKQLNNDKTMLLDLNKTTFNCLERFVYETAFFHFNRLNSFDPQTNYVEFWCKDRFHTYDLHVDCDEHEREKGNYIYPLQSCISYFTKSDCPTIITKIDMDSYLYKDFETQKEILLSFPESNKQITFDGKFFHGSAALSENDVLKNRHIIAINLWNIKPSNVEYYKGDNESEDKPVILSFDKDKNIEKIMVQSNTINTQLFENLLYKYDKTAMYDFKQLVNSNTSSYRFIKATNKVIIGTTTEKQINKSRERQNIFDDIKEIMNPDLKYNRFMQRFKYSKIYTPEMCRYIINESEKHASNNGGWTTQRHKKYPTTDLSVDKIPSIFTLVLETLNTIIGKIKESYGLNEEIIFDIKDLFVVKYKHDEQNHLELHHDESFISFNILLSNHSNFEGGGTYFEDGITTYLEQGDILIHSSRTKHAGQRITKGERYILVGFLDIKLQNKITSDFDCCALNFE